MNTSFDFNFFKSLPLSPFLSNPNRYSIARILFHWLVQKLPLSGNVLDIGGGSNASYKYLLSSSIEYQSVNIDPIMSPTFLIDPSDNRYPIKSASFDHCLLFNVLEHIYDWTVVLSESRRLLRTNGQLHIVVPFLYPIHPCPDDFLRPTPSFIYNSLLSHGFINISVYSFSLGPLSTSYSLCIPLPFIHFFLSRILIILDFLFLRLFPVKHKRYRELFPINLYCVAS